MRPNLGLLRSNANVVLPEFQQPEIGDIIPFGPEDGYPIVLCEHGQAIAIETWYDLDAGMVYDPKLASPISYLHLTWLWYVEFLDAYHARFISRNRVTYNSSIKNKIMFGLVMEPIVFAMDRKMCLGIKKRAEQLYEDVLSFPSKSNLS
jgi:hypothetical protein